MITIFDHPLREKILSILKSYGEQNSNLKSEACVNRIADEIANIDVIRNYYQGKMESKIAQIHSSPGEN